MASPPARTALVLSAGGVRGAYQVGVIAGIIDVLGLRGAAGPPLFDTFSGVSVGALNAAYLAANADRPDHAIDGLLRVWTSLRLRDTLRPCLRGLWGWPIVRLPGQCAEPAMRRSGYVGRALFNPRPLERLLERVIDWDRLHANVRARIVRAIVVAAYDIYGGYTNLFAELAPGVQMHPDHPTRRTVLTDISAELVLASTSLPFIYPARNIGGRYYMDGALRFATPMHPALRTEADRVVVISLLSGPRPQDDYKVTQYPGFSFLLAKVFSALVLDPALHDVERVLRTNQMFDAMAKVLSPADIASVTEQLQNDGVMPCRKIPTLVFRPSEDLGQITTAFIREQIGRVDPLGLLRRLSTLLCRYDPDRRAELASILLLDGRLAARLLELGRRDAHADAARILAFFS